MDAPTPAAEIYRSARASQCEERALVLAAVGIASSVHFDGAQFALRVDTADAARATAQLGYYEAESRFASSLASDAEPGPQSHPGAWIGCVIYGAVLLGIASIIARGLWRLDAFDAGELNAAAVQSGQWWRAWTALTLHLDAAHLLANLAAGIWFGYLAARQIGSGNAWFLIVTGAACANLLEALLGPSTHRAVGASTAVFTALGLWAAHSWRLRLHLPQRWALRWAPLVGGLVLLGWFGAGTEDTDLVAHALGFAIGALLGLSTALPGPSRILGRTPQWLGGLAAFASVAIGWACALSH